MSTKSVKSINKIHYRILKETNKSQEMDRRAISRNLGIQYEKVWHKTRILAQNKLLKIDSKTTPEKIEITEKGKEILKELEKLWKLMDKKEAKKIVESKEKRI